MKRLPVLDAEMAYVDVGQGDPIVFLHGNPTSSYMWRNVIPYALPFGRVLAPDLIGMGQSSKSPRAAYRYFDHVAYLDEWFDKLGLTSNIVLVIQDWGAALGFDRASRYPDSVIGVVYMEAMVRPRLWTDMPPERQRIFRSLRGPEGETMVLRDNYFVEKMLFEYGVIRKLTDEEKAVYAEPFATRESRLPTLVFPREIPFDGEPADMFDRVKCYSEWMGASKNLPKLFINAAQGHGTAGAAREHCRQWPNQTEVTVEAKHYVPEDCPHEIGAALVEFLRRIRGGA
ncbi:haloalkane dehalogenase [Bradyrhizobium genosp. P]|uniref:haloalkane dehalogenase n=1 Tax=Bradyrhizobium genosp. P TaxID=83641 RepID=UPI003CF24EB3